MRVLEKVIDLILPPRCIVTGEEVDYQGMVSPSAWASLRFIGNPYCQSCGLPFDFEVEEESLCAACLTKCPDFASARAALVYDDVSRDIILSFKHGDQIHAVQSFVPWLKAAGQEVLEAADILAPVPLHRWRLLRRRYNQAALMAAVLGQHTNKPNIPDLLYRRRATASQGHLNPKDREKNVRRAFRIHEKRVEAIKDKAVLLIDDVYTTGATVNECAKVLKKAGASTVHVLTLARVVRASDVTG